MTCRNGKRAEGLDNDKPVNRFDAGPFDTQAFERYLRRRDGSSMLGKVVVGLVAIAVVGGIAYFANA